MNKHKKQGVAVLVVALIALFTGILNQQAQMAVFFIETIALAAVGLYTLMRKI